MAFRLVNPKESDEQLRDSITHLLSVNLLCDIATVNDDGTPHISTAFFAYDDQLILYFLSDPDSIHAKNIARSPKVAVAIYDGRQIWGGAHSGLQVFGDCEQLSGALEERARQAYTDRFLLYPDFAAGTGTQAADVPFAKYVFYGVTPSLVKVLDELKFGDEVVARSRVETA